ncbi:DNA polymerase III subunit chi [Chitiniphilus shinanonensis]|uniref:DNA polymerase III subunit chi n=1 Tax=Chitiniphilus shinanonensis TaxID=553088 RepID=A0ABQ6BX97_9NEIS|nr:DNA polymerase III subunit chi [Chitiniphilus shinanonensis]GLS04533.1 DNA polymerase III subunit chi [Chitiniphilus shinanonensis]
MDVTFYFNVKQREQALCQLVGKALAQRLSVNVLAASERDAHALDRLLWEVPQTGFLPHCAADDPLASVTPVVVDHRADLLPERAALFNWTDGVPEGHERHARILEIVDRSEEARERARQRWRAYVALGITPTAVDMLELAAQRQQAQA